MPPELGLNPSTVGRILARHRVPRLAAIDPITGQPVRSSRRSLNRYEHSTPGAVIHVDVKKLGRIPTGGGWRLHGRSEAVRGRGNGYDYVHTAIDDHTRLAYSEFHPDEKDASCAGFLHRALAWFADHGLRVRRVLTDNAKVYRLGTDWGWICSAWQLKRRFTQPGPSPRTLGGVLASRNPSDASARLDWCRRSKHGGDDPSHQTRRFRPEATVGHTRGRGPRGPGWLFGGRRSPRG